MRIMNKNLKRQKRKVSDSFREFVENFGDKCRELQGLSKKADRIRLSNDIRVQEVFHALKREKKKGGFIITFYFFAQQFFSFDSIMN